MQTPESATDMVALDRVPSVRDGAPPQAEQASGPPRVTLMTPALSRRADPDSALPLAESRGIRFNADAVVHRVPELLLAPEVALGGLNRHVPKEELDLVQFAAGEVTQPRTRASQIVRRQLGDARLGGRVPNKVPEHLRRHPTRGAPRASRDRGLRAV